MFALPHCLDIALLKAGCLARRPANRKVFCFSPCPILWLAHGNALFLSRAAARRRVNQKKLRYMRSGPSPGCQLCILFDRDLCATVALSQV